MSRPRFRKPLFIVLLLFAVAFSVIYAWRWNVNRNGREKLNAVVDKIDSTDYGWRWEDLEATKPAIPDDENAAFLIEEFRRSCGIDRRFDASWLGDSTDPRDKEPNRLLSRKAYVEFERAIEGTEAGWPSIERLSRSPRGRFQQMRGQTWVESRFVEEQNPFVMERFVQSACEIEARDRKSRRLETLLLAMCNVARINELAPFRDHALKRLGFLLDLGRRLERGLALDAFGDRLALLQAELLKETEVEPYGLGVHIIRADYDRLFRAFDSGEISLARHLHSSAQRERNFEDQVTTWLYRPHMASDFADAIDFATRAKELADLPEHERWSAFGKLPAPAKDQLHLFSATCISRVRQTLVESLSTRAYLRCTVTALAAERHRLLTGEWPATLDAIPKTILQAVRLDPFTNKPLLYARRPDGVTIYSPGVDGVDNGGMIDNTRPIEQSGVDVGFRLYNPDHRRIPAVITAAEK